MIARASVEARVQELRVLVRALLSLDERRAAVDPETRQFFETELRRVVDDLGWSRGARLIKLTAGEWRREQRRLAMLTANWMTRLWKPVLVGRGGFVIVGVGTFSWDPGNLVDGAGETKADIAAPGAKLGDAVSIMAPYTLSGVLLTGYVHAADTVAARLQNKTGGAVDLAAGTYHFVVKRYF